MENVLEDRSARNSQSVEGSSSGERPKRKYNSSRRAEQAAETRRRIVEAAARCFSESGYGRTTLAKIAVQAGVSAESVAAHGPKGSLLMAAFEYSLAGSEGQQGVSEREEIASIFASTDPGEFLDTLTSLAVSAHSRTIGIWRALNAAASEDDEVDALYRALADRRRAEHLRIAEILSARGWLRPERTTQQHGDTIALLIAFDPYQLFVREFGSTEDELREWMKDALKRVVFRDGLL